MKQYVIGIVFRILILAAILLMIFSPAGRNFMAMRVFADEAVSVEEKANLIDMTETTLESREDMFTELIEINRNSDDEQKKDITIDDDATPMVYGLSEKSEPQWLLIGFVTACGIAATGYGICVKVK